MIPVDPKILPTSPEFRVNWDRGGRGGVCWARGFRPTVDPRTPKMVPKNGQNWCQKSLEKVKKISPERSQKQRTEGAKKSRPRGPKKIVREVRQKSSRLFARAAAFLWKSYYKRSCNPSPKRSDRCRKSRPEGRQKSRTRGVKKCRPKGLKKIKKMVPKFGQKWSPNLAKNGGGGVRFCCEV